MRELAAALVICTTFLAAYVAAAAAALPSQQAYEAALTNSPIVSLLERQLEAYYRSSFHGFVCYPGCAPSCTDYYDYWADDAGKILTAAAIVGNHTIAYQAFEFLYGLRAYGYMMPARLAQIAIHPIPGQEGYYGNNIIALGGCPLSLGVELFGFNYVASLASVNGLGGCDYRVMAGNGSVKVVFGDVAEVILGNFDYFLVKPLQGSRLTLVFKPPWPVAYIYSRNYTLAKVIEGVGSFHGNATGVASYTNYSPFGNTALYIVSNISSVTVNSTGLVIHAEGYVKVYVGAVTVDYGSQQYVMLGLLKGLYPYDADASTPASFGYIALGSVLLGLETHNSTVLGFARGFINFWLPIVKDELFSGEFYPRSVSTFLTAALLLEPDNESIRSLALSYVESPETLSAVEGGATGYGLTAWLIAELAKLTGLDLNSTLGEYYRAQVYAISRFRSMYPPPLPIDYSIPYKVGEDLFGWLEAGLPFNDTNVALPLMNIVFDDIIDVGANPPPFYVFFNYANTEGVPAILESVYMWQLSMLNSTGITIVEWRYLNVTGISVLENESSVVLIVKANLMPPNGIITHLEVYIPYNPLNITVNVDGKELGRYGDQSMYIPTQKYLTYTPTIPSGWYYNNTTHILYIQYFPTPTALFNESGITLKVYIAKATVGSSTVALRHFAKVPRATIALSAISETLALALFLLILLILLKLRKS